MYSRLWNRKGVLISEGVLEKELNVSNGGRTVQGEVQDVNTPNFAFKRPCIHNLSLLLVLNNMAVEQRNKLQN